MNAANENHIKLLTRPELELDSLKLSIDKADKELTRERAALRKFQRSIQSVQKCKTAEVEAESLLAEQLSLYIAYNSEVNIIKSLELFQNSINELSRLRSRNADTLKDLFLSPVDDLLKNDLKNQESLKREWSNAVDDYETKVKRIRKGLDQGLDHEQLVLKRTATDYFIKRNQAEKARGSELAQKISRFASEQLEYHKSALRIAENLNKKLEAHKLNNNASLKEANSYGERLSALKTQFTNDGQTQHDSSSYNIHQITGGEEYGNTFKGQIFMKKTGFNIRAAYKKKYAVVSKDGYLYVYRSKTQDVRELKINLLTSDVRQSSDKKFIHLITVERNKPYTLMAENAGLTQRWVSVIANARQSQLKRVFEDETSSKLNPANRSESQTAITDLTKSVISEIQKLPGNQFCADCRKANPDWLSVNLGILVCLNCSGLHRKLGVNYSKIQSIELDNLGTASLLIARKVGNELFNEAYEGTDTGIDKPNAESSQMTRDNFITRKYIDKAYVQRTAHHKDLAKDLAAAIADGDMHSIIQAFAEGARPESIIDHKTRKTCLHLSVDYPKLHVVEFLLQNAPDAQNDQTDYPGPTDVDGNTILHRAIANNLHPDYIRLITRKYPKSINHKNKLREDPFQLSKSDLLTEVLSQAEKGAIPKLLHVDVDWELNRAKETEPQSDDDIIDDSSFGLNETPNWASKKYEEPSTDPNFLSDTSMHEEQTISSLNSSLTAASLSSTPNHNKFGQQFNQKLIAELQQTHRSEHKSLKPVMRNKSSPNRSSIQAPKDAKPKNLQSRPNSLVNRSMDQPKPSFRESLPPRPIINNSISPQPFPRTVQTSAIPTETTTRVQLQSDNGQYLIFEQSATKKRNSNSNPTTTQTTSNAPARSESFPRGEQLFNSSKYQANKRRSGHFETPEYSTPVTRDVIETKETEKLRPQAQSTTPPAPAPSSVPPPPQPEPSRTDTLPRRVQALYDCDGDEDDELSFCSGEIIQVTGREDDDWWIGNIEAHPHRKGCFPVIFVTKLDD